MQNNCVMNLYWFGLWVGRGCQREMTDGYCLPHELTGRHGRTSTMVLGGSWQGKCVVGSLVYRWVVYLFYHTCWGVVPERTISDLLRDYERLSSCSGWREGWKDWHRADSLRGRTDRIDGQWDGVSDRRTGRGDSLGAQTDRQTGRQTGIPHPLTPRKP